MIELPNLVEVFEKEKIKEDLNQKINDTFEPRNRAERRAMEKAIRQLNKRKRQHADSFKQAAEELTYIKTIEKVKELRERIEKEEKEKNEAATENN